MGTGVSLGLPWLECMADETQRTAAAHSPKFCAMYFGFGVSLPEEASDDAQWRWFPKGDGANYHFNESLKPLEIGRAHV